ncbi:MAG: flagellar biosynthesis protein FlhB [Denitrovibrio sp.]|nr:MAG: flagellar biosynthesis protein FlhB [Denitrovibrio sp.]
MAENQDGMEKSEQPTWNRKWKSRRDGNVAKSKELPPAVSIVVLALFFYFYAPTMFNGLARLMREFLMNMDRDVNTQSSYDMLQFTLNETSVIMAPFAILLVIIAFAVNIYMVGFLFATKPLEPKFSQLNPFKGFGKFFKIKSLVELIKSLIKVFAISYLAYFIIRGKLPMIISMADMDFMDILRMLSMIIFEILLKIGVLVLIMAILDYQYQKWQHNKDLMMTKHEVKEERKQMEGDPQIKRKIRQIQRDMARQRMMDAVPSSDVVVTNPTHYAVALKYDGKNYKVPVVVAKGQRLIALRIKEIAKEQGVHIHENAPLARSLFKTVDIGDEIPENLYKSVAEILALVDKFKRPA